MPRETWKLLLTCNSVRCRSQAGTGIHFKTISNEVLHPMNVAGLFPRRIPWLRVVAAAAGGGAIALAAGVELFGLGARGLGALQLLLATAGFAVLLVSERGSGLSAAQPPTGRSADWFRYLTIAAELGVLMLLLAAWQLEGPGFYERLAPLVFFGFLLHHALPLRWRPTFFLLLSLMAIGLIVGAGNGALLVLVGCALLGICHLPIAFGARIALLVVVGLLLGLSRAGLLAWGVPTLVWPVLASMFMFRLMVYMYDLRHGKTPRSLAQRLSYFFMLPNVVFPLFPVVDSNAYHRRYYDAPAYAIYQQGIGWMLRGVVHLLVYRLIYQRLTIAPSAVADTTDLARYILAMFGLYLRVSGQFHIIVGMLHLFGHRLPETHRLYFLASSFTDFWRRINIYWKDFIQKLVFFPVHFRLRGRGETFALVVATVIAFFATWLLHSYQWFWILGRPLFSAPDALFWVILAVLVVANSLIERKHGRMRKVDERRFSFRESLSLGFRTAATFIVLSLLWALWNSSSLAEWRSLFGAVEWRAPRFYLLLAAFFAAAIVVASGARWLAAFSIRLGESDSPRQFTRQAVLAAAGMAALLSVLHPAVVSRLSRGARIVLLDLRSGNLNPRDAELLHRGYYENLLSVNSFTSRLWEFYTRRPDDWLPIAETAAGRVTGDFFDKELVPNASIIWHELPFHVNHWGMRDREYDRVAPAGTYRIALLGASYAMGAGVRAEESFEGLIEERLNRESPGGRRYEILNFAVPGYTLAQQVLVTDKRVLDFAPDALWLVSHPDEYMDVVHHVVKMVRSGVALPYPYLQEVVRETGLSAALSEPEAERRLRPKRFELLTWTYREIVSRCRERGIRPVWIFLPATRNVDLERSFAELLPLARAAGFDIVDLSTVYEGQRMEDIILASYDSHPNPAGHRIIADHLYTRLRWPAP